MRQTTERDDPRISHSCVDLRVAWGLCLQRLTDDRAEVGRKARRCLRRDRKMGLFLASSRRLHTLLPPVTFDTLKVTKLSPDVGEEIKNPPSHAFRKGPLLVRATWRDAQRWRYPPLPLHPMRIWRRAGKYSRRNGFISTPPLLRQ